MDGSSYKDFVAFPDDVQDHIGYAIYVAQLGGKHEDAKPLRGFGGAGVLEVVSDHSGDTFRAIYTVKFQTAIYVLHAFQKKSKSGRTTPTVEIDLISRRLKTAQAGDLAETQRRVPVTDNSSIRRGTQNIFADLGYADADTHLLKAGLVKRIGDIIVDKNLTPDEAAEIIGVSATDVSRIKRGLFRDISVELLVRMLRRLGCDVDIVVRSPGRPATEQDVLHLPAQRVGG